MKLSFLTTVLLLCVSGFSTAQTTTGTTTTTPVIPTDNTSVEQYNDQNPMPESFEWLASPEGMKAYALRQVTTASLAVTGDIVSLGGFESTSTSGGTPNEMLQTLARQSYRFSMPDKTKPVQVYVSLSDSENYSLFDGFVNVVPSLQSDGTYLLPASIEIEMQQWQKVDLGPGIVSVKITNDMDGYTDARTLYVYGQNGTVQIPVYMLSHKGHFLIVRSEPDGAGSTRLVSYGYEVGTGTGKSVLMTTVRSQMALSVKNYFELSDSGRPLYLAGSVVPLMADMRLVKERVDGKFAYQSQPVARVEVTTSNRLLVLYTGLTDTANHFGDIGTRARIRNTATGTITPITLDANGTGSIILQQGSYDLMYYLPLLDSDATQPRG